MCHKSYKSHAPHKISLVNIFTVVTLTTVALGPIKQKQNNIDLLLRECWQFSRKGARVGCI